MAVGNHMFFLCHIHLYIVNTFLIYIRKYMDININKKKWKKNGGKERKISQEFHYYCKGERG